MARTRVGYVPLYLHESVAVIGTSPRECALIVHRTNTVHDRCMTVRCMASGLWCECGHAEVTGLCVESCGDAVSGRHVGRQYAAGHRMSRGLLTLADAGSPLVVRGVEAPVTSQAPGCRMRGGRAPLIECQSVSQECLLSTRAS